MFTFLLSTITFLFPAFLVKADTIDPAKHQSVAGTDMWFISSAIFLLLLAGIIWYRNNNVDDESKE